MAGEPPRRARRGKVISVEFRREPAPGAGRASGLKVRILKLATDSLRKIANEAVVVPGNSRNIKNILGRLTSSAVVVDPGAIGKLRIKLVFAAIAEGKPEREIRGALDDARTWYATQCGDEVAMGRRTPEDRKALLKTAQQLRVVSDSRLFVRFLGFAQAPREGP